MWEISNYFPAVSKLLRAQTVFFVKLFHVLHNEDKPHSLYSGCDCMLAVDLEWACLAARAKFSLLVEMQGLFLCNERSTSTFINSTCIT